MHAFVPRAVLVSLVLWTLACGGDEPELREWRPSDHQVPRDRLEDPRTRSPRDDEAENSEQIEARAAEALFRTLCASCHGAQGRGDGSGRPPVATMPDLTSEDFQASRSDGQLAEAIRNGRGAFMPSYGDRLSAEGIAALVRHIRRLGGRSTEVGASERPPSSQPEDAPAAPTRAPASAPRGGSGGTSERGPT